MYKHLTLRDRVKLQYYIEFANGSSLRGAADILGFNTSTVYREIMNHRIMQPPKAISGNATYNPERNKCSFTTKFPYTCNNCDKYGRCVKYRYKYDAYSANEQSRKRLRDSRSKPSLSNKELKKLDNKISDRVLRGQSLYHILESDKTITKSESTIRRYIGKQLLTCRNIDLPRTVRFQARRTTIKRKSVPIDVLNGRTYQDYTDFVDKENCITLQIDTVVGLVNDSKFVLTIFEPVTRFQWGYLLPRSSAAVNKCIHKLVRLLQRKYHKIFFDCFLTDNGSEFLSLYKEENDLETGEEFFKLYFCDPYSSFQKGGCERNHELLRYIYKKKKTLDTITQDDISEAFSNINSLTRKILKGKTPFQAFTKKFKIDPIIFGIKRIDPKDIKFK